MPIRNPQIPIFIREAVTGDFPPAAAEEWVLKHTVDDGNVLAVRNLDDGGYSTYTCRTADGHEVLAVGYGNPGSFGFFADQNYVQSWSGILGSGEPKRLIITMDGDYGAIGSGFRFYLRQSFEPEGDIKFWQLIPYNTAQRELMHLDTTNNRVLIGYNSGALPERQLHVVGPSTGGNLLLDSYATNAAQIFFRNAGGANGALTQTASGQGIINLIGAGYTNSSAYTSPIVGINGAATEALTSTGQGTRLDFRITPIGSTTIFTAAQLTASATITRHVVNGAFGHMTGAGGTVTQGSGSGKATGVTLNKPTGAITLNNATLNADTTVSFTLTNNQIEANDIVVVTHKSAGTGGAYNFAAFPAAGSATIFVRNVTTGNLGEAIVLSYTVIKGVIT